MSLFGSAKQTMGEKPKSAQGVRIQSSAYGVAIPILFGRTRVTGNVIWYGNFQAIAHTNVQSTGGGGSGGGGAPPASTSYTYTAGFIMGFCEGPIQSFHRVWSNKRRYVDLFEPVLTESTENHVTNGSSDATVTHAADFYQDGGARAEVDNEPSGQD